MVSMGNLRTYRAPMGTNRVPMGHLWTYIGPYGGVMENGALHGVGAVYGVSSRLMGYVRASGCWDLHGGLWGSLRVL